VVGGRERAGEPQGGRALHAQRQGVRLGAHRRKYRPHRRRQAAGRLTHRGLGGLPGPGGGLHRALLARRGAHRRPLCPRRLRPAQDRAPRQRFLRDRQQDQRARPRVPPLEEGRRRLPLPARRAPGPQPRRRALRHARLEPHQHARRGLGSQLQLPPHLRRRGRPLRQGELEADRPARLGHRLAGRRLRPLGQRRHGGARRSKAAGRLWLRDREQGPRQDLERDHPGGQARDPVARPAVPRRQADRGRRRRALGPRRPVSPALTPGFGGGPGAS